MNRLITTDSQSLLSYKQHIRRFLKCRLVGMRLARPHQNVAPNGEISSVRRTIIIEVADALLRTSSRCRSRNNRPKRTVDRV